MAVSWHEKILSAGEPHQLDFRILTPQNRIIWLQDRAYPAAEKKAGTATEIIGGVEDITRRKTYDTIQEINTLILDTCNFNQDEESRYRSVLEGIQKIGGWDIGSYWMIDPDLAHLHLLLFSADPALNHPDTITIDRQNSPRKKQFLDSIQTGKNLWFNLESVEEIFSALKMQTAWGFPIISSSKNILGVFLFFHAQLILPDPYFQELAEPIPQRFTHFLDQEEIQRDYYTHVIRTEAFLSAIPDMILTLDRDGVCTNYRGTTFERILTQKRNLMGARTSDIFPQEIAYMVWNAAQLTLQTGAAEIFECQVDADILHEGRSFEFRVVASSSAEIILIIRDITERTKLEALKSDFINRASHELRTPVTTAILTAGLIQEGGPPQEIEEYWKILVTELERQRMLLDRLLMVGRIESGNLKLKLTLLAIPTVIAEAVHAIQPLAEAKNIAVQVNIPAELPEIMGDSISMQQILGNLLSNAIKFSPPDSTIRIAAKMTDVETGPDLPVTSGIQIMIQDQGIGIPAEEIPLLFQRFYRAKNAVDQEIPGSGVGLFIIKSILDGIGGSIRVESKQNCGTSFFVTIPLIEKP